MTKKLTDKERLDWLEKHHAVVGRTWGRTSKVAWGDTSNPNEIERRGLRQAIDAAIRAEKDAK